MSSWIVYKSFIFRMGEAVLVQLSFNLQLLYNQKMMFSLLLSIGFVFATASADSCEDILCSSTNGCSLEKNNILTTLHQLNKRFFVSFEFRATEYISGWQSVIHFTEGGNNGGVGQRVPGFWVKDAGHLYPRFAVNGNGDYGRMPTDKEYSLNKWHSVQFSQSLNNGKYMYRVVIDGEDVIRPVVNYQPQRFSNIKVYGADNFYNSLKGSIKNLIINTDSPNGCGGFSRASSLPLPHRRLHTSGSLKLDNEVPYMLVGSAWMPICGHFFWDNNIGADIVCQSLGFQGGVLQKERRPYSEDAYYVGRCDSRSITDLVNGCTKEIPGVIILAAQYSCKKGRPVSIKVKCKGL